MKRPQIRINDAPKLTNEEIVETLLAESGIARSLPTDENKVLNFLGLEQLSFDFTRELDFLDPDDQLPADLRAALSLNDKIVAIHSDLSEKRSRFSVLHEVAHFILPEHREKLFLFLDDDQTLSWWTQKRLEQEANRTAAELLFQGHRFTCEAIDQPLSLQTVLELAPKYGASYEAAGRRFTERHVLPCALVVYDKVTKTNEVDFEEDVYRLQYTVTSNPFRKQFFRNLQGEPNKFTASELYKPKYWGEITESELIVGGHDHSKSCFETEVFSNGYKIFQFVKGSKETR
jgi:Zn-dependent peptidase ImmA (M78 family)